MTGKHSYNIDKEMVTERSEKQTMSSLLSCQISVGATIILPLNIVGVTVQGPLLAIFTLLYAMEVLEQAGNYLPSTKTSLSKRQSEGQKRTPLTMSCCLLVSGKQ